MVSDAPQTPSSPEPPTPRPPSALRHFRRPLLITAIALGVALVLGLGGTLWIHKRAKSRYEAENRVKWLGQGLGFATILVIFPFWIFAADKVGKERRAARAAAREQAPS